MSTVVSLVNSTPTYGLGDGYRRSQIGNPVSSAGQPPKFRGEVNTPGNAVKAPRILASAARQNRQTNVTVPYARVTSSEDLVNKGRLSPGDIAFISRYQKGISGQLKLNQDQKRQVVTSVSTSHAHICRLAGLDWVNRALGPTNYKAGSTVLVNSPMPLDDWRSLALINEWTVDGVVLSNDSPGYVTSVSNGVRNDQVFNIGVQGPVQLNNGYEDDQGRGIAIHYDRRSQLAAGNMAQRVPPGMSRKEASQMSAEALIAGPAYTQYPLQMFDRKIKPLSDVFIGLICRKIEGAELDSVRASNDNYKKEFATASHIHVFEYRCFSSRQIYQFATTDDNPDGDPDLDIVDAGRVVRDAGGSRLEAEPADRRRGPNDPKRGRNDSYLPRKRQDAGGVDEEDTFLGIKKVEVRHMVGAWRIGKVLDVASQRQASYTGGPIDTAFSVTLNFDLGFLDWRQLRRNFTSNIFGYDLDLNDGFGDQLHWTKFGRKADGEYKFEGDFGRVMQWPTMYVIGGNEDGNVPFNPTMTHENNEYKWKQDPKSQIDQYKTNVEKSGNLPAGGVVTDPLELPENVGGPPPSASRVADARAAPLAPPSAAPPSAFAEAVSAPPPQAVGKPLQQPEKPQKAAPVAATPAAAPVAAVAPAAAASTHAPAVDSAAKSKPPAKRSAVAAIGDDVMASIFGSAVPSGADAGASCAGAPSDARSEGQAEKPKSFPRRRDR